MRNTTDSAVGILGLQAGEDVKLPPPRLEERVWSAAPPFTGPRQARTHVFFKQALTLASEGGDCTRLRCGRGRLWRVQAAIGAMRGVASSRVGSGAVHRQRVFSLPASLRFASLQPVGGACRQGLHGPSRYGQPTGRPVRCVQWRLARSGDE